MDMSRAAERDAKDLRDQKWAGVGSVRRANDYGEAGAEAKGAARSILP